MVLALDAYLRLERPAFQGRDAENEPFFLTEDGLPFAYSGWSSMRQRFRHRVARLEPAFKYQASRSRGTRTAKLRENDYSDSEIMQLQGWTTHGMIRRYAGDIPRKDLERKPGTTSLRPAKLRRVS